MPTTEKYMRGDIKQGRVMLIFRAYPELVALQALPGIQRTDAQHNPGARLHLGFLQQLLLTARQLRAAKITSVEVPILILHMNTNASYFWGFYARNNRLIMIEITYLVPFDKFLAILQRLRYLH